MEPKSRSTALCLRFPVRPHHVPVWHNGGLR